jgi:hypothetical protein
MNSGTEVDLVAAKLAHERSSRSNARFTMHVAWIMAVLGAIALALGIMAVPIAGNNCPRDCISYPYLETVDRFPRDYLWIYVAILLVIAYLVFIVSLRSVLANTNVVGQVAAALAVAATVVLVATYFSQASVVPASLAAGETEGIALLTMYNPHGMFIALEEIGYLLMSLSFLFATWMVIGADRMVRAIRSVFAAGFIVPAIGLVFYAAAYGLDRQDRFEVVALSADWLVLIVNGILVALLLRNRLGTSSRSMQ